MGPCGEKAPVGWGCHVEWRVGLVSARESPVDPDIPNARQARDV